MQINGQDGMIAALDVGSSKVACLIAHRGSGGQFLVKGVGNVACDGGVVGGAVVDMALTEKAIKSSLDMAEKMAGSTVSDVILSFSGGEPVTRVIEITTALEGPAVTEADVNRATEMAKAKLELASDTLLHFFPAAFNVDGNYSTNSPLGMYGKQLGIAFMVVTASSGPLKNLDACVRRAHLNVKAVVLAPYAAGLACLVDDEIDIGAICIDMGAGTTNLSIYAQGTLVYAEVLPIGGSQITEEIARSLLTPIDQAEKLKNLGSAISDAADERIEIEVLQIGESGSDRTLRMPRSAVTSVIQQELELLFSTIAKHIEASGYSEFAGRRVVLTGGVARCDGIRDLASKVLGRQVRIGYPKAVAGLPGAAQGPGFAGAVGLLAYAASKAHENSVYTDNQDQETTNEGVFGRVSQWIKETF